MSRRKVIFKNSDNTIIEYWLKHSNERKRRRKPRKSGYWLDNFSKRDDDELEDGTFQDELRT